MITSGRRLRRYVSVAVAVAALVLSSCATGEGAGSTDRPGFGAQICGRTGDDVPGYAASVPVLPAGARRLSGAGSTFVAPVMSVWAERYAQRTGVRVAYQPIGSGGGVAQVNAGTVDFGASDTPMTAAERADAGPGRVLHVPVTLGAVVPAYHVRGLGPGVRFDGEVLGGIFAGRIRRWDDEALRRLNPQVRMPDKPIVVVHRSDASGTTAVWTDFLTKRSPTWIAALGPGRSSGKQVLWPVGLAGKGNDGVAGMLGQVDGAIAYVELSYVLSQGLPYGQVRNRAGAYIQPCAATVRRAADGVEYPADLTVSFTDGPDPDAYPIVGTTFVLVHAEQTDAAVAAALVNFLAWVLTTGQDLTAAIGYAPLGSRLQQLASAQLRAITTGGTSLLPAAPRYHSPGRRWHAA